MEDQSIAPRVMNLLASSRGVPLGDILPSQRLYEDLGMGDREASDFFSRLHHEFGTDLRPLHKDWINYFPARLTPGCGATYFFASLAMAVAAFWAWPIVVLVLGLVAGWYCISQKLPHDRMAITVAQVVAAVEAGSWPRDQSSSIRS